MNLNFPNTGKSRKLKRSRSLQTGMFKEGFNITLSKHKGHVHLSVPSSLANEIIF